MCWATTLPAQNAWPTTTFTVDFAPARGGTTTPQEQTPVLPDDGTTTMPPAGDDEDPLDVWGNRQLAYDAIAMVFENYLNEIAESLQAEGFEPPNLPVYQTDSGELSYRVQVVDTSREDALEGLAGVYHSAIFCGDNGFATGNWFGIEAETFHPLTSSQETYLYYLLAHELFHAVQASYPATDAALTGCSGETADYDTASEGTAEAVAGMLTQRRWPKYYLDFSTTKRYVTTEGNTEGITITRYNASTGFLDEETIGLRSYDRSFLDLSRASADERKQAAYMTVSFWFNVLDRYGIRFADHLLRQPLAHGDWPSLAEWLDGALRSWTPTLDGLYSVYPHFVAEFAGQIGSRFPFEELEGYSQSRDIRLDPSTGEPGGNPRPGTDAEWRKYWIERILGECKTVVLQPDSPQSAEATFAINRLSANCLEILWTGFEGPFELYIEAEHPSLRHIDQVNIGLIHETMDDKESNCYEAVRPHYPEPLWTCTHDKPFLSSGSRPLVYTKRWSETGIEFSGEGQRFVAISNVAANARATRPFSENDPLVVRVGIAQTKSQDGRSYSPPFGASKGMGNPMAGFTAEAQYGITENPAPAMLLFNFGIPLADGQGQYGVAWLGAPPQLGYSGPFTGAVTAPQQKGAAEMVASNLCPRHRDGVVGQVVRFDRNHLWIDIDAELCKMVIPPPPDGNFPVVDRVQAQIQLPFGWRYDATLAPADLVTPGMEIMIDRHARRVPMVMSGTWGLPGEANTPGGGNPNPGDPGAPGGNGNQQGTGSSGAVVGDNPCECTCEELEDFDARAEALKLEGDEQAMMDFSKYMMACMTPCQREYMLCRAGFEP